MNGNTNRQNRLQQNNHTNIFSGQNQTSPNGRVITLSASSPNLSDGNEKQHKYNVAAIHSLKKSLENFRLPENSGTRASNPSLNNEKLQNNNDRHHGTKIARKKSFEEKYSHGVPKLQAGQSHLGNDIDNSYKKTHTQPIIKSNVQQDRSPPGLPQRLKKDGPILPPRGIAAFKATQMPIITQEACSQPVKSPQLNYATRPESPPPPLPPRQQRPPPAYPEKEDKLVDTKLCTSPLPERRDHKIKTELRRIKHYTPQAYKFFMEQHIENILKEHNERCRRKNQLEKEMIQINLSPESTQQLRRILCQKESNYLRLKRAKLSENMFEYKCTLGKGAFGQVNLVQKIDTKVFYAMKTLTKNDVVTRNQVAHVKAERDILAEADNEWVVRLYYSFQDAKKLYFVMEYIPGGDLMSLLIRKGRFDIVLSRFYIAELVLAIESVHKMGFIHRDIKPDNVLIDSKGHIKLTDFGLCTGFRWTHNSTYYNQQSHNRQCSLDFNFGNEISGEPHKTLERRREKERKRDLAHSLVGTPNYIAPEVLQRENSDGYNKTCDWWSVGVILYEMLVGSPPFNAKTPYETQLKVINFENNLKFPSNLTAESRDFMQRLLVKYKERLGAKNGAQEIKQHSFFADINFERLRSEKPPYVPKIAYATDVSNFDQVETIEHSTPVNSMIDTLTKEPHGDHPFYEFTYRRFFNEEPYASSSGSIERDDFDETETSSRTTPSCSSSPGLLV